MPEIDCSLNTRLFAANSSNLWMSLKCAIHWIIATFWFYSESMHATFDLNPWMPLQTSHINFRYSSWNDLGEGNVRVSCQWTEKTSPQTDDITMAGVNKATVMKCIRDNFISPKCEVNPLNLINITKRVATSKLRQPLSNMDVIFNR